jgi:hypothetical protein
MQKLVISTSLVLAMTFATSTLAQSFKRITTEEEYRASVVGRKMVDEKGNWFMMKSNGKMTGKAGGKKFSGVWNWQSGFFCRNGRVGTKDIGSDCQIVELSGNTLRGTRKQGKGDTYTYTLQ